MRLEDVGAAFLRNLAEPDITVSRTGAFRFTENGLDVTSSGGQLARAESLTGLQTYADQGRHQVVLIGLARIGGEHHAFALRLAVAGERVSEAEAIVASDRLGHFSDVEQLAHPDIVYGAPVPEDRASDELELLRIADSYWEALEAGDGSMIPVDYRCDSFHNGKRITNNLSILLSPDATVHTVESLVNGTRGARPTVLDRRYPVIDTQLGIVISFTMADFHTNPHSPRPDNGSFYLATIFKIVDGRIRVFDEIREILPLGATSGWQSTEERV